MVNECLRQRVRVCAALAVLCVPMHAAQLPPPPAPGAIAGVVIDAATGRPVPGARVSLRHVDTPGPGPRVLTDPRGRFIFANLPPAKDYFIDATGFGYVATRYGWDAPGGPVANSAIRRIPVAEGQLVTDIRVPLWRLGSISGRVSDERGEPVVGVTVRAFQVVDVAGNPQVVAAALDATDDRGMYRLPDIMPGQYVVGVLSVQSTVLDSTPEVPAVRPTGQLASGGIGAGRGASVASPTVDVDGPYRLALSNFATPPPPNAGEPRAYPATFFPAMPAIDMPSAITMNYGDVRRDVDFQLQPVRAVRVSGHVDTRGLEMPRFLLRLMPRGAETLGFGSEAATTEIGPDGAFTFLNVPAGDYTLIGQGTVMDFTTTDQDLRLPDAPGFPGGGITVGSSMIGAPGLNYLVRNGVTEQAWIRQPLSVGTDSVAGLVVPLQRASRIRGRFVFADGVKPPDSPLFVYANPANGDPSLGNPNTRTAQGDRTFTFTLDGLLSGTYLLDPMKFAGMLPESVVWAGRDVKDTGFDATTSRDFDDVVVTLTNKFVEITGSVMGSDGPASGAVLVFPSDRRLWTNFGWTPPRFQAATINADGRFTAARLPAGEYYVVAVPPAQGSGWLSPRFMAAAVPQARLVKLAWGEKTSVELRTSAVVVR